MVLRFDRFGYVRWPYAAPIPRRIIELIPRTLGRESRCEGAIESGWSRAKSHRATAIGAGGALLGGIFGGGKGAGIGVGRRGRCRS